MAFVRLVIVQYAIDITLLLIRFPPRRRVRLSYFAWNHSNKQTNILLVILLMNKTKFIFSKRVTMTRYERVSNSKIRKRIKESKRGYRPEHTRTDQNRAKREREREFRESRRNRIKYFVRLYIIRVCICVRTYVRMYLHKPRISIYIFPVCSYTILSITSK